MFKGVFRLLSYLLIFLMGWAIGYLNLPYLQNKYLFWLGSLAVFSAFAIAFIFKRSRFGKKTTKLFKWSFVFSIFLSIGLFVFTLLIERKEKANEKQQALNAQFRKDKISFNFQKENFRQRKLVEKSLKNIDFSSSMKADSAIIELQFLTKELNPVQFQYQDSLLLVSPGRGILLKSLFDLQLDSSLRNRLIKELDFSHAYLKEVDFSGLIARSINLHHAYMLACDLSESDFQYADLSHCMLKESNFDNGNFDHAKLNLSNLNWSTINNASFISVEATGATFDQSVIKGSIMDSSDLRWGSFRNSDLESTSFYTTDFLSANLKFAYLKACDLRYARVVRVKFKGADLTNAKVKELAVSEGMLGTLDKIDVQGADAILSNFEEQADRTELFPNAYFYLRKKGD